MRVYALLLGLVLTTGYGYAAQVAVSSAATARRLDVAPTAGIGANDRLWYGGVIDPIIVESRGGAAKTAVSQRRFRDRPTVRCIESAHSHRYHAAVS